MRGATRVKISRYNTHSGYGVWRITVPKRLVEVLPDDALYEPELTDEGILFRFTGTKPDEVEVPSWAQNGDAA